MSKIEKTCTSIGCTSVADRSCSECRSVTCSFHEASCCPDWSFIKEPAVDAQLRARNAKLEDVASLARKVTMSAMGGEPDMFWPDGMTWEAWDEQMEAALRALDEEGKQG